ncbi:hypothetical protein VULLAG_LOCUS9938 [Vulpes lagopus]
MPGSFRTLEKKGVSRQGLQFIHLVAESLIPTLTREQRGSGREELAAWQRKREANDTSDTGSRGLKQRAETIRKGS